MMPTRSGFVFRSRTRQVFRTFRMARTPSKPSSFSAKALRGAITGLLVGVSLHAGMILGGSNFHTVLPGEVYRSGQPT